MWKETNMPSSLKYYKRKPKRITKRDWKGSGHYYHKSKHPNKWVKYSVKLDKHRGKGIGTGKWRHTHDRRCRR